MASVLWGAHSGGHRSGTGGSPEQGGEMLGIAGRLWTAATFLLAGLSGAAQTEFVCEGHVLDAHSGEPVPGAAVFAVRSQRGTFSTARGFFRLVLLHAEDTLRVRSLGYDEACIVVRAPAQNLRLALTPAAIRVRALEVAAELSPEEVIANAQQRRRQNWERIRTLHGLLYSKLVLAAAGAQLQIGSPPSTRAPLRTAGADTAFAILETFSRFFYDAARGQRALILQRRQTRNIPPEANQLVFGNLGSLYQEQVEFLTVRLPSPIGPEALERYRFRIRERRAWGGHTVYVLELEPRSQLYPAFEGTIAIVESSFALVEADVRPSGTTALPYVQQLRFLQRCETIDGDIWIPTFSELSGIYRVRILSGIAEVGGEFRLLRILTEVRLNEPIPDTVFASAERIQVAPQADSAQTEFWQRYALVELSPREVEIYRRMDSIARQTEPLVHGVQSLLGGTFPLFGHFQRVNGVQLGVTGTVVLGWLESSAAVTYAFGRSAWEGWAELRGRVGKLFGNSFQLAARAFAWTEPVGWDRTYPEWLNSVLAALAHRDYYDWGYREGWSAAATLRRAKGRLTLEASRFRFQGLPAEVQRSIFLRKPFRENPHADDGHYWVGQIAVQWGEPTEGVELTVSSHQLRFGVYASAGLGRWQPYGSRTWQDFWAGLVRFQVELPTVSLGGYPPMKLRLWAELGRGRNAPFPYQFRLRTSSIVGRLGHCVTAPEGVYGGRYLVAWSLEHTFGDLWWRALGLPTVRGRGLELILGAAAAQLRDGVLYRETGRQWYSELFLGIGRIPVPLTELVVARATLGYGVGPLARGRWGGAVQLAFGF